MVRCLWWRKQSFLWILASRSVGHSVDSKSLSLQASVWSVHSVGTTDKRTTSKIIRSLYEHQDANLHDKLQLVSLQISNEPYFQQVSLSDSEIMTILLYFGTFRIFKHYYLFFIKGTMKSYFPKAVSYNRFVDIGKPRVLSANYFLSIFVKVKFLDLYIPLASFGVT